MFEDMIAEQIDAKMKMSKILHAITVSALIAFMVFIGMKIASINIYDISSYFTDFGAILLIIVMFKLDWHKLDQIVSRNVIILIAITVVMFLIPAINDFIMTGGSRQ